MFKIAVIVFLLSNIIYADVLNYFKEAVRHLKYDKVYSLYKESKQLSQNAIKSSRYNNFSADITYTRTYAKGLRNGFNSVNFSLNDTIDIFGKNSYKIEMLQLDIQSKRSSLALQKERLFISLVTMVAMYHRSIEQKRLYQTLFNQQNNLYKKLQILEKNGDISNLDLLRFGNNLSKLKSKILFLKNQIIRMRKQLKLYAPKLAIPSLHYVRLKGTKKSFLAHNPKNDINRYYAYKKNIKAKALKKSYLPVVTVGTNYQRLNDPTSYGNNYSFNIGLHIPLNRKDYKEAEALKVDALRIQSKSIEIKIERGKEYILYYQSYLDAQKELAVLKHSLKSYKKSEKSIKEAYLQHYIDFNAYLQVLSEELMIKEQIIALKYQSILNATIINAISSGKIYE